MQGSCWWRPKNPSSSKNLPKDQRQSKSVSKFANKFPNLKKIENDKKRIFFFRSRRAANSAAAAATAAAAAEAATAAAAAAVAQVYLSLDPLSVTRR